MERAINLGWSTAISSASWILSAQFRHLCSFLDVYLESLTPTVFPQKTVFFKSVRFVFYKCFWLSLWLLNVLVEEIVDDPLNFVKLEREYSRNSDLNNNCNHSL